MNDVSVGKKKAGGLFNLVAELSVVQSFIITVVAVLFPTLKNIDVISQIKAWELDGLFVYQIAFAVLATLSAFLILYMVSVLATSDKACTVFKKYFFYTLTCLLIFVLSLSLREFYAPTSSFTSYFLGKELNVNYSLVQNEAGITFEVVTCSKSGRLIKCNLEVSNVTSDDMNVGRFDRVSLYDQNNNQGNREKVIFDGKNVGRWDKIHLTKKSSTKLSLYFNMSDKASAELVKKLDINFHYFGNDRRVTFRNLELTMDG
ncbi:hypothetical protein GCM10011369_32430 [Neiella marina]|uniref:Uncharacterized protein n=1 Tax=Neiella marina TaxID=508461 RepID=A0A8J2U9K9_9GAMM|nr:hypothetical protein [Neiella marina]GGA87867.1 hypothetical protein GCM10011369_32430 [Neiella marina]